jgi:hypothetical protein
MNEQHGNQGISNDTKRHIDAGVNRNKNEAEKRQLEIAAIKQVSPLLFFRVMVVIIQ